MKARAQDDFNRFEAQNVKRKDFEKDMDRKMKAVDDSKRHHEKLINSFNQSVAELNTSISNTISEVEAGF